MDLRIYLTGPMTLQAGGRTVVDQRFPARQGRLAFAYLVAERIRPIPRDELAEVIWADRLPDSWDAALSAIVSKLRGLLHQARVPARLLSITTSGGRYALHAAPSVWIDVETAANAIDEAEGSLRAGDARRTWGLANVAVTIYRRPFLPGVDNPWVDSRRAAQRSMLVRGLEILSDLSLQNGESALAAQYATEAVALEPFRETGYQRLMRAHAGAGNRAEALRVYERCRRLLAEELGTDPAPETEELYLQILRGDGRALDPVKDIGH